MTDFQIDYDNRPLLRAVKFLKLKFPAKAIGDATGYSKGNISKYLTGKLKPSGAFLDKFQECFNVNLKDFDLPDDDDFKMTSDEVDKKHETRSAEKDFEERAVNYVVDNSEHLLKNNRTFQLYHEVWKMKYEIDFMRKQPEN